MTTTSRDPVVTAKPFCDWEPWPDLHVLVGPARVELAAAPSDPIRKGPTTGHRERDGAPDLGSETEPVRADPSGSVTPFVTAVARGRRMSLTAIRVDIAKAAPAGVCAPTRALTGITSEGCSGPVPSVGAVAATSCERHADAPQANDARGGAMQGNSVRTPDEQQRAEEWLAQQRAKEAVADAVCPPTPPCPAWCAEPAGHRYDSVEDYDVPVEEIAFVRYHETTVGNIGLSVAMEERNCAGVVTTQPPDILVMSSQEGEHITAAQARQWAAQLLDAADRLDEIAGGAR